MGKITEKAGKWNLNYSSNEDAIATIRKKIAYLHKKKLNLDSELRDAETKVMHLNSNLATAYEKIEKLSGVNRGLEENLLEGYIEQLNKWTKEFEDAIVAEKGVGKEGV